MYKDLEQIVDYGRLLDHQNRGLPTSAKGLKACEEMGELATAALYEQGYLQHKRVNESSFGEAADVVICVLDLLQALHPNLSHKQVVLELAHSLDTKFQKWKLVTTEPHHEHL